MKAVSLTSSEVSRSLDRTSDDTPGAAPESRSRRKTPAPRVLPPTGDRLNRLGIRTRYMLQVLEQVAAAFQEAGITLMALKGAALHLALGRQLGDRPMVDLDLLIHPGDLDKARTVLRRIGAVPGEPLVRPDFCPRFYYEEEYAIGRLYPIKIDLHVRPLRLMRFSRIMPDDALWARAGQIAVGRSRVAIPSVEDMLIHLAAHSAIHGNRSRMWLRDIRLWCDHHRETIDWSAFLDAVDAWRLALPVRMALAAASQEHGPVYPEHVRRDLEVAKTTWSDRMAIRQAPRDHELPFRHVLVNLLTTPGWRFRLSYLLAVALPSRAHLADWYPRRHRGWVPVALLSRWLRPVGTCLSRLKLRCAGMDAQRAEIGGG